MFRSPHMNHRYGPHYQTSQYILLKIVNIYYSTFEKVENPGTHKQLMKFIKKIIYNSKKKSKK